MNQVTHAEPKAKQERPQEFKPSTDVIEYDDRIVLYSDMPGVTPENLDASIDKNVLTISADIPKPIIEGFKPVYREYRVGRFSRSFTLGDDLDSAEIKAEVKAGIVTITIPKAAKAQPRKIAVQVAP